MNEYLRSFVIGSSLPVFLPFFLRVMNINDLLKNYSFSAYSIIAPLYFGLINMISQIISNKWEWDLGKRLIITGIISPIIVFIFAKLTNSYNFPQQEWFQYFIRIFLAHFLTFNITIHFLEKNV